MNDSIKQILIGLILGDGYITPPYGASCRSRLDMKADSRSLEYLQWLRKELTPLGVSELRPKKGYHQHRFITATSREIWELRQTFYPGGVKIIPESIGQLLCTPLSLAVWFQDDGHLDCRSKYHYNAIFATHCFSFESCKLLANALHENFGLDVRVNKCTMRGTLRYKLYVTSASMPKFIQLIEPYIISCYAYKIRKLV